MPLVICLFFISGATALVYEVVWSKYLGFMFGSTIQAQTVVLAVFMGGLALGNTIISRWSDGLKKPLVVYGLIELLLGIYAFSFHSLYQFTDQIFVSWGSGLIASPNLLLLLKGFLSLVLLGLPTVLMGGTLPLIASWLNGYSDDPGRMSARFYAINTLGAVAGSAIAGFYFIHRLGLLKTLEITAVFNVGVGLISMVIGRRLATSDSLEGSQQVSTTDTAEPTKDQLQFKFMTLLVMVVGGVSMGLEVVASRTLALVFGGSLQSFSLVLIAFILGIGIGSSIISSRPMSHLRPIRVILTCLIGASLALSVLILTVQEWALLYAQLKLALARNLSAYFFERLIVATISILVLGIPAGLLGTILPLTIRAGGAGVKLGKRTGLLLTWNTVGAVVGVILTGFVLMPTLGLPGTVAALAAVLAVLTVLVARMQGGVRLQAFAVTLLVITISIAMVSGDRWMNVLNAGGFRSRVQLTREFLDARKKRIAVLYYKDAADASVAVERIDPKTSELTLRVNGKADASTIGDLSTQFLLAHIPFMMRPDTKQALVYGLGSGITAGAMLGHP